MSLSDQKLFQVSDAALSGYLRCPKYYEHRDVNRMVTVSKPHYLHAGAAAHKGWEVWAETRDLEAGLAAVRSVFAGIDQGPLNADEIKDLGASEQLALGMLPAYTSRYVTDFANYPTRMIEKTADFKLWENGEVECRYRGYLDALYKDQAGNWWVVERKFLAKVSGDIVELLHFNRQILGYMWLAKETLGEFPAGVIYDVVIKPGIRQRKGRGESVSEYNERLINEMIVNGDERQYFRRYEIKPTKKALQDWVDDTKALSWEIWERREDKSRFVKNSGSCQSMFSTCAYMEACRFNTYGALYQERTR